MLLFGALLGVLLCCTFGLRLLARGLGIRVPLRIGLFGLMVAVGLLLPWLVRSDNLLGSTDFLSSSLIPGARPPEDAKRYELLNDGALQFLPWEMELRRLWREGEWGFWSDSLEGGSSPWVNPQASVLSPTAWIARAFPIQDFFLVKIAVQLLVCFLGTAVLVRRLGGAWSSGALAGVAAALGGGMIPWATFTHAAAAAWVPWTTVGLVSVARSPKRRTIACTGLLVALLLVSGHPEVAFAGGCLGVLVAFSLRSRRGWRARVGGVLLAAGLGFLLAAPAILPFLAALGHSQRAAELGVHQQVLQDVELGWDPRSWFLPGSRRVSEVVLHPYVFGKPFLTEFTGALNWCEAGAGYAGLWALAGGALALGLWLRRSMALLLFWGVSVLLASGFVPLLWIALILPGFSAMAFPRMLLVASIALSVAAGLGFDAIRRVQPSMIAYGVLLLAAMASVWAGGLEYLGLSILIWSVLLVAVIFGEPSAEIRSLERRGRFWLQRLSPSQVRWPAALLAAILVGQLPWAWQMLPSSRRDGFYPSSAAFNALAAASEGGAAVSSQRVLGFGYLGYPSLLSVYRFDQTRSHNPMASTGWLRVNRVAFGFAPGAGNYFAEVDRLNAIWLDALAIGAVLAPVNLAERLSGGLAGESPAGLSLEAEFGPFGIYRNPDPLPRWFAASSWEVVKEERLEQSLAELEDPRHALLSVAAPPEFEGGGSAVADEDLVAGEAVRLEVLEARPGAVALRVGWPNDAPERKGFLLATSLAGPAGWRVRALDSVGDPLRVGKTTVHGAFVGAWVPPEAVELRLRYVPPLLRAGLVAMVAGLVLLGFVFRSSGRTPSAVGGFRGRLRRLVFGKVRLG